MTPEETAPILDDFTARATDEERADLARVAAALLGLRARCAGLKPAGTWDDALLLRAVESLRRGR